MAETSQSSNAQWKESGAPKVDTNIKNTLPPEQTSIQTFKEIADIPDAVKGSNDIRYILDRIAQAGNITKSEQDIKDQKTIVEATSSQETSEKVEIDTAQLQTNEAAYLEKYSTRFEGLQARYADNRTNAEYVSSQVKQFAETRGVVDARSELAGKSFDNETRALVLEKVTQQIDVLFNSDQGTRNPEKHKIISEQTQRFMDLVAQALAEGDFPADMSAETVYNLVSENIATLAFQDRVASENLLGDHGVRHLVDHNIRVCETVADQLQAQGQTVKAIDRLMMHQIMIDHDIGYAMDPVRQEVNKGNLSADRGHNLLAAKYTRQRIEDPKSALTQVFTQDQLSTIHEGILYHDSSQIEFKLDNSENARTENILSAIHLADNTHAFADKLPELLYSHADTLQYMRLMKTAAEIGDDSVFQKIKAELVKSIQLNSNYSQDDKDALVNAAHTMKADGYKYTVGRICGNKPEITLDASGKVTISVTESAIHREVVGLFAQGQHDQLRKFAADLTGKPKDQIDLNTDNITSQSGKLEIKAIIGVDASSEQTDYDERVQKIITNKEFQAFIMGVDGKPGESELSKAQEAQEAVLKQMYEDDPEKPQVEAIIARIKQQRADNIKTFLDSQHT